MNEEEKPKKVPIDRAYYSTEDEDNLSDYEVSEKELYPNRRDRK